METTKSIKIFKPKISLKPDDLLNSRILQRPGNTGRRIDALILELLRMIKEEDLLNPRYIYREQSVVSIEADTLYMEKNSTLQAPLVINKFNEIKELVVGVCTIGEALEGRVKEWFEAKKSLQALVLDQIGNAAVSKLASRAKKKIRKEASIRKLEASSSLSPGAVGFDTNQQALLCEMVSAEKLGVIVQGSIMMHPHKSLSFVVGLGTDMPRWTQAEECRYCSAHKSCPNRVVSDGEAL
ncbi:MAG: hypothetical protein GY786_00455 [Proteobacteria bacterium]|nr:hypothetical protein [Pseudomonadota bacterium]